MKRLTLALIACAFTIALADPTEKLDGVEDLGECELVTRKASSCEPGGRMPFTEHVVALVVGTSN